MFWEHEGNAAVRIGRWKLVKNYPLPWELYDMDADCTELHHLAAKQPKRVADMARQYDAWAKRCGVIPREPLRRADEGAGRDAGVLGEGRVAAPLDDARGDRPAKSLGAQLFSSREDAWQFAESEYGSLGRD